MSVFQPKRILNRVLMQWTREEGKVVREGDFDTRYCAMQSDGNSFGGDVVLKSVNIGSSDEDGILDQIYKKQIFSDFFQEDFTFQKEMHIESNTVSNDIWSKKLFSNLNALLKLSIATFPEKLIPHNCITM